MPDLPVDRNGKPVAIGSRVRILGLSGDWFDRLAPDERVDVASMIGEVFTVDEIDEYGHPWVSKSWNDDGSYRSHSIALEAQEMALVEDASPGR